MKLKIAIFRRLDSDDTVAIIAFDDGSCWADQHAGYVRLTETAEVELKGMPAKQVLDASLKALAKKENNLRAEFQTQLFAIEEQRRNLLSLEAPK